MPADAEPNTLAQTMPAAGAPVAKEAPTEQQTSQAGIPKKITNAQTVCNEKNAKGKLCNGHLKQLKTGGEEAEKHLRGDDVLFRCQTCGTLYMGPPLGHVRDPEKQARFVEKELTAILRAAGGTLPAFKKSERGTLVPLEEEASHHAPASTAPVKPAAAAKPTTATTTTTAPANETPEERKARLIAEAQAKKAAAATGAAKPAAPPAAATKPPAATTTSGTDSAAEADRHRPAAEAQAATGQASAAPMSSTASTASPAAGAETVSDLAPEASTELTPGAPPDERSEAATETPKTEG